MSSSNVNCSIGELADVIMDGLKEYVDLASEDVKNAVRKAGKTVKNEISANAPKRTGAYSKSWTIKSTKETSESLELVVYSKNKYQLAHLLEFGHAKRGGGRTKAFSHIAPAEEAGVKELEENIRRSLGGA